MQFALSLTNSSKSREAGTGTLWARRRAKNSQVPSLISRRGDSGMLALHECIVTSGPFLALESQDAIARAFGPRGATPPAAPSNNTDQSATSDSAVNRPRRLASCVPSHGDNDPSCDKGQAPFADHSVCKSLSLDSERCDDPGPSAELPFLPLGVCGNDLPTVAFGAQDKQYALPGPAANPATSSAGLVNELKQWATTPGGGIVYPWSTSTVAPPSANSQHHVPSSTSTFANDGEVIPRVLDPRFGNLTIDLAHRMLPEAPNFVDMTHIDSGTSISSSRYSLSTSSGATSNASINDSVSPIGSLSHSHDKAQIRPLRQRTTALLHAAQNSRRGSSPREQRRHSYEHLSSVSDSLKDSNITFATTNSALAVSANSRTRRRSATSSNRRYICRHPACDKACSTSGHARRHEHTHSPLNPFLCPHESCDATFSRRDNCIQHQRAKHSQMLGAHRLDAQHYS